MKRKYEVAAKEDTVSTKVSIKYGGTGLDSHTTLKLKLGSGFVSSGKKQMKVELWDSLNTRGNPEVSIKTEDKELHMSFLDLCHLRDILFAMEADGMSKRLFGTTVVKKRIK